MASRLFYEEAVVITQMRYHEIVKGFTKIPDLGDEVVGVYATRQTEHRQSSEKKRQRKTEKRGKIREWHFERHRRRKFLEAETINC